MTVMGEGNSRDDHTAAYKPALWWRIAATIYDARLLPYALICRRRGHTRCGNDCLRCGKAWPW